MSGPSGWSFGIEGYGVQTLQGLVGAISFIPRVRFVSRGATLQLSMLAVCWRGTFGHLEARAQLGTFYLPGSHGQ